MSLPILIHQFVFVRMLIPFLIGIGLAFYISFAPELLEYSLFLVLLMIAFPTLFPKLINQTGFRMKKGVLLFPAFFLLGCAASGLHNELVSNNHFSFVKSDYLLVKLTEEPRRKNTSQRVTAKVIEGIKAGKIHSLSGQLLLTIKTDSVLNYGQILLIPARYNEVPPPRNPYEFDYKQYLRTHNIHYQAYLKDHEYRIVNQKSDLTAWAIASRKRCVAVFEHYLQNKEQSGIVSAFLLGYRADLSPEVVSAFSNTGTIHILSVSGMHVAIIYMAIRYLLIPLSGFKGGKIVRMLLALTLVWFYTLITGFSPAVCRAAFMISVVVAAEGLGKSSYMWNTIALSAFSLLLFNPYLLFDLGFQLSYLAVIGIVYFQPLLAKTYKATGFLRKNIWGTTTVSVSAQLTTLPLSVYYFHQFPLYFLAANIVLLPLASIILFGGIILLLFSSIPFIAHPIAFLLSLSVDLMNWFLLGIANMPGAVLGRIWINPFELFLLSGILGLLALLVNVQNRRLNRAKELILHQKRKLVWGLMVSTCILCFAVCLRTFLQFTKKEQLVFNLNNKSISALVHRDQLIFFADSLSLVRSYNYSLKPFIERGAYKQVIYLSSATDTEQKIKNN